MDRNDRKVGTLLRASWLGALAAVAVLFAQPRDTSAQAGTEWLACQAGAWSSYNGCLVGANGWWDMKLCDIAFDLDMGHCAMKLIGSYLEEIT
jgi:hypothetical protein